MTPSSTIPARKLTLGLKSIFSKAAGLFGGAPAAPAATAEPAAPAPPAAPPAVSRKRQFSRDYEHYPMPSGPVTPETLAATPPHIHGQDGKALVWAYIGKDDPTRGDSRGANGLAREMARLMGGRAVYIDQKMLDRNFKYADGLHDQIAALIARDGAPDAVIGTTSSDIVNVRSCKPTMIVNNINESIDSVSRERTNLVPHDLTPEILEAAGREFRTQHPDLKGKLHTVMVSSFYSCTPMEKLALILAQQEESTVYFCPNRRAPESRYRELVSILCMHLLNLGIDNRVRVIAPTFDEIRNGYNPYRGLIAESDHMLQIGDSHSMVAEAVCTGRPLYLTEEFTYYKELANMGYVRSFTDAPARPLPASRLAPISVTAEVAGRIVEEFDRLARLRTIGTREKDDTRRQQLERLAARHNAAYDQPGRKIA